MSAIIVRAVPKTWYWFIGIWLYPIASIVFTGILVIPISNLLHHKPSRLVMWVSWAMVTIAVATWAYLRDYRRMHYTLTSETLIWGRGSAGVVIPFSEIESIVTGLPDRLPWWIRMQRFCGLPGIYRAHADYWKNVPVLKLRGSRYLPLCVGLGIIVMRDFQTLVVQLLRLNSEKIVSSNAYDEKEVRGLVAARYNIIKSL